MKRTFKRLFMMALVITSIVSCEKSEVLYDVIVHNIYSVPDSVLTPHTRRVLDEFGKDTAVTCKHASLRNFATVGQPTISMWGIRQGHLWFRLVDLEHGRTVCEYTSCDEVIERYTWKAGNDEMEAKALDRTGVHLNEYVRSGSSEIALWRIDGDMESIYKVEFKSGSGFKSFYDPYSRQRMRGYESFYYHDICYSMEGDTLYRLGQMGKNKFDDINTGMSRQYVFVSTDDIMYFSFDGDNIIVNVFSLKNEETLWTVFQPVQHRLSSATTKVLEYTMTQVQGPVWDFLCTATDATGLKVSYSFSLDISTNPGSIRVSETEIQ